MKKIFLLLTAIILTIPSISFATSGACSSHGGVDCSAGPALGGKVMCNDGWINSSVYFSSAQECNTQEADIRDIDSKISKINSQISQLEKDKELAVSSMTGKLAQMGALDTTSGSNFALDAIGQKYQSQIDSLNIDKNYLNKLKNSLKDELKQIEEQELTNVYSCPLNSHTSTIDSTKCDCDSGYQLNSIKDSCIIIPIKTKDELCKTQFGSKSNWDGLVEENGKFSCKCSSGYVIDSNNKCVTLSSWCLEKYGSDMKTKDGKCVCSDGYNFNKESQVCKKDVNKLETSKTTPTAPSIIENMEPVKTLNWDKEIINPEPVIKLKWYQKIFNWFKGK